MRIFNTPIRPIKISVIATIALLAGCSASSSPMTPTTVGPVPVTGERSNNQAFQAGRFNIVRAARGGTLSNHAATTPSFMEPSAVGKPLIFLVDLSSNVVNIYLQTGQNKMVGQITGYGPGGIATDAAANLYVTNSTASYGNVLVFAPPYTGPPTLTLDDPGYYPTNVAISPQGIVAVLNYCSAPSCGYGTGNLLFYAHNATSPCATVTDPNLAYPESSTFDDKGNLFVDGQKASGGTTIGEVTGGCAAKNLTLLTTTNTVKVPGGIHVDKADRIAMFVPIPSGSNQPAIYTYKHPRMGSLGNPVLTTPLDGAALGCVDEFAFKASSRSVFVADFCDGVSAEYAYPAGGAAEKTIAVGAGEPSSVAVTPPTIP
jgi:hypothetical protein